jgi:hypothetical protein
VEYVNGRRGGQICFVRKPNHHSLKEVRNLERRRKQKNVEKQTSVKLVIFTNNLGDKISRLNERF